MQYMQLDAGLLTSMLGYKGRSEHDDVNLLACACVSPEHICASSLRTMSDKNDNKLASEKGLSETGPPV